MEHNRVVYTRPYDAEVEYLETTGTQWLDTGYYGDINTAMECICKVANTAYGYVIAGSRTSATIGNISFVCGMVNNYYQYMCDFGDYTNSRLLVKKSKINDYIKLYTSANLRKAIDVVNETEYTNGYVISSASQTPYTLKICHHDGNYPASHKHFRGRIKSFKLWSSNILLLDLIPVRKGNIGYMYDRISGKLFGNKGTGNFILGQDVANTVPNIRRVFRFRNKRFVMPMPYDRRVEYLESTGTQYIDTGIYADSNYVISIQAQINKGCFLFNSGSITNSNAFILFLQRDSYLRFDYGNIGNTTLKILDNNLHTYSCLGNKIHIDGSYRTEVYYRQFTTQTPIKVFYNSTGKLYKFQIKSSTNVLLIDLIPVRKNGIGYMYDRVSCKLFGNSGTGQFILGNDIND